VQFDAPYIDIHFIHADPNSHDLVVVVDFVPTNEREVNWRGIDISLINKDFTPSDPSGVSASSDRIQCLLPFGLFALSPVLGT
jgi:hypothetical protein